MRLADRWGMSYKRLLREYDAEEIEYWRAYDRHVEVLHSPNWAFGMLASIIVNMMSGKDARRVTPQEFIPIYEKEWEDNPEQDIAILNAMIAKQNASK